MFWDQEGYQAHSYGGGEEEDRECDYGVCVYECVAVDEGEKRDDKSVVIFVGRSGGD